MSDELTTRDRAAITRALDSAETSLRLRGSAGTRADAVRQAVAQCRRAMAGPHATTTQVMDAFEAVGVAQDANR